jgi:hypothetical protein
MEKTQYEAQLQKEVDPTINFREHAVNKDIVGIYYGDIYTETAIPNGMIYPTRSESYVDNFGYPHRGSIEATERVKGFVERFKTDEEFRNDILGIEVVDELPNDTIETKIDENTLPKS